MYHSEVLCHTTFLLCIGGFWSLSRVKTMTQALASVHTQSKQFQTSSVSRLFQHFGVEDGLRFGPMTGWVVFQKWRWRLLRL
jgi:hypothetical protein